MTVLVTNIQQLVGVREKSNLLRGNELANLPCIENAFLVVKDGLIAEYGTMEAIGNREETIHNKFDATGQCVLPTWCDSHTHLVFAASREDEFVDKIKGLSYSEIAAKGGGILNSAKKLAEKTELELVRLAWSRLQELIQTGTGAVEIKSGYGLSVEAELKMLRVIKKLKETSPMQYDSQCLLQISSPLFYGVGDS